MEFNDLPTVKFANGLRGAANAIYQEQLGAKFVDIHNYGDTGLLLDKALGLDGLLRFPSGNKLSVQEKFRDHDAIKYGDVTFEIRNGDGTQGEFDKLAAQLYFYGWATPDGTEFADWILLDVTKLKLEIEFLGGAVHVGMIHRNQTHGSAKFVSIEREILEPAIVKRANVNLETV